VTGLGKLREFWSCARAVGTSPAARWNIFWSETKNVRVRLGLAAHRPHQVYNLDTTYGKLHLRDNFGDITNLPGLLHRGVYRPPSAVGEGTILDVGANIGLAAAWFRREYPGRDIHCFEPLEENARLVPLNCPGATVRRVAVGRTRGFVDLAVDADAVMASTIPYSREAARRTLEVVTLDEHVREHGVERVALLKIDTEGMELDVLAGASRTLSITGVVAMETHGMDRHRGSITVLEAAGFAIDREEFHGGTGLVFASRRVGATNGSRGA
jgi:FkbM family methyltransferase